MAARIIPFPAPAQKNRMSAHKPSVASNGLSSRAIGIHLVSTSVQCAAQDSMPESQQHALRIVEQVEAEHAYSGLPSSSVPVERSPQFWATLPIAPAHAETPLTVARRLAHMLLAAGELA